MAKVLPDESEGRIKVADVTLAQLARGLYRSTACTFKELVSNSFDADAENIRIDTNYPEFNFISCVDDGNGMTLEEFHEYFEGKGIGVCLKRKGGRQKTEKGRPIIGQLGIGMMAIGQLCHSFKIESHYVREGREGAFWAEIILYDIDLDTKTEQAARDDFTGKDVLVGKWYYKRVNFEDSKKGFRIYTSDVRETFTEYMKRGLEILGDRRERITFKLGDIYKTFFEKAKSVKVSTPYLETLWELEMLCPLPYYNFGESFPLNTAAFGERERKTENYKKVTTFLKDRQGRLKEYDFRVTFNGIELRRLIQFPKESDVKKRRKEVKIYPRVYYINKHDKTVGEGRLEFSGYFYAQIPKAITPSDLNGVLIRLREVGIGKYDPTFLGFYEKIETIKSKWVSGEIFVDAGLDDALNIDRDSFNEHDEHYKLLQNTVHEKIHGIFRDLDNENRKIKNREKSDKEGRYFKRLEGLTRDYSNGKISLIRRDLKKTDRPVYFDPEANEIIYNQLAEVTGRKNADKVFGLVLLAREIANRTSKSEKEKDEKFSEVLKDILGGLL